MEPLDTAPRLTDDRRATDPASPAIGQRPTGSDQRPIGRQWTGRADTATVAELSIGLFALAVLAFSPPLLVIFGVRHLLFGIPLLYVYLFVVWGLVIALLARLAKRADRALAMEREQTASPTATNRPAPTGSTGKG